MDRLWFIVAGRLDQRTGGYIYDARTVDGLRAEGWEVSVCELGAAPHAPAMAAQLSARLGSMPDGGLAVVDGLCLAGAAEALAAERARLRLVGLVHHPVGLETGLSADAAQRLLAAEAAALKHLRRIVVTSPHTARVLERDLDVAPQHIAIVEPGTDPAPVARGSGSRIPHLLAVGSMTPRKGYEVLVAAMNSVRELPWQLAVIGGLDRDPAYVERVRRQVAHAGLDSRIALRGEFGAEAVGAAYDRADVFVSASWYEGFGMAVAEAVARGLPVVATAAGAVTETLPAGAGVLVPPGDVGALAQALSGVIGDRALRADLAAGARAARSRLTDWPAQAPRFADALTP